MPTLYIANCSKQHHSFVYRIPEESGLRRQMIPPGGQITAYQSNIPLNIVDYIIAQHTKYGLTDIKEIDRRKPFVGLCYSLDRAIIVDKIMQADEHNADVLTANSQEQRKLSAAALHGAMEKVVEGAGNVRGVKLELVEQNGSGEAGLNEQVIVSREPVTEAPTPTPRQAARKRRAG